MRRWVGWWVGVCLLSAAVAVADHCEAPETGACGPFGLFPGGCPAGWVVRAGECPPPPTPTPTPTPTPPPVMREAEITWKPSQFGTVANYVEEPTAVLTQEGHLWVLGHAGHCCDFYPRGWETPFLLDYGPGGMVPYFPLVTYEPALYDDMEMDLSGIVRLSADAWALFGGRTTNASWPANGGMSQNRVRGMVAVTPDPRQAPIPGLVRDWLGPWDAACQPRNSCAIFSGSIGPNFGRPVWIDGELYLYLWDDVGYLADATSYGREVVYRIAPAAPGAPVPVTATRAWVCDVSPGPINAATNPWTDVALGDDGNVYALSLSDPLAPCFSSACHAIREWVSRDGGRSFELGTRSWSLPDRPGTCVWYGGYIRDEWGRIERGAVGVVGMTSDGCVWATPGPWNLHVWADEGLAGRLPVSLWSTQRPPRRHLSTLPVRGVVLTEKGRVQAW